MGDRIKVFLIEPTKKCRRSLRRTRSIDSDQKCPSGPFGYCHASQFLEEFEAEEPPASGHVEWPRDDSRWPTICSQCGYLFTANDTYLVDHDRIYRRTDTGEEFRLRDAPVGAIWDAHWYRHHAPNHPWTGPDGRTLVVKMPDGGDWVIDSRASNCTKPDDKVHKCWVRHGRPEDGTLHVDKNGNTCAAGAGSIQMKTWHGFLHNGHLVEC